MNHDDIFHREYGDSKNFMTPEVLDRGEISSGIQGVQIAYELSKGEAIFGKGYLFGVSLVVYSDKYGTTNRVVAPYATVFRSLKEAKEHVEDLKLNAAEVARAGRYGEKVAR